MFSSFLERDTKDYNLTMGGLVAEITILETDIRFN